MNIGAPNSFDALGQYMSGSGQESQNGPENKEVPGGTQHIPQEMQGNCYVSIQSVLRRRDRSGDIRVQGWDNRERLPEYKVKNVLL